LFFPGNVSASRTEVPTGTPTWTTTAPDDELSSPLSPLANERALFKDLFEQYEKNLRPNYNSSEPLKVELGLSLRRIEFLVGQWTAVLCQLTTFSLASVIRRNSTLIYKCAS
jgi:hypothetical protein